MNTLNNTKRTDPLIPVGHPEYRWSAGADVQATWRRYGWAPVEEIKAQQQSEKIITLPIVENFTIVI